MASITVSREDLFPNGTTVSAYEVIETRTPTSGAPSGSVVDSGTVSGGSVTLTGLTESKGYWLYASSPDRYLRVYIPLPDDSGGLGLPDATGASADDILTLVDDGDSSTASWLPPPSGTLPTDNTDGQILGSVGTTATWLDVDASVSPADIGAASTDDLTTHAADTTSVHGIADTSALATSSSVSSAISTHEADTTSVHGIADTSAILLKTLADAKGDLLVATADDTIARVPVGSNDQILTADSAQTAGVKWAAAPAGGGGGTNFGQFDPVYDGMLAQSFPLVMLAADNASQTNIRPSSGRIEGVLVPVLSTISVTNVLLMQNQAGSSLTSGQNKVALYSVSGSTATKIGETADQTTAWQGGTAEPLTMALAGGPFSITGGAGVFIYAAILSVGTTPVGYRGMFQTTMYNNTLAASKMRVVVLGGLTGQTSLPSTITISSNTSNNNAAWVGLT